MSEKTMYTVVIMDGDNDPIAAFELKEIGKGSTRVDAYAPADIPETQLAALLLIACTTSLPPELQVKCLSMVAAIAAGADESFTTLIHHIKH
jgi:hypothetical protein